MAWPAEGADLVYLTAGVATHLEVPAVGKRYTEKSGLEEVGALVRSVLEGRFRESVWMQGDRVVRAVGEFGFTDAEAAKVRFRHAIYLPCPRPVREDFNYLSYGEGADLQ